MHAGLDITDLSFRPPNDGRLSIEAMTVAELKARAPAHHFEKLQRADFFRLFGVRSGATSFMVDFSIVTARPMDWVLLRPGQVMRYDFAAPWEGWLLAFRPDQLISRGNDYPHGEHGVIQRTDDLACLHTLEHQQHHWMDHSLLQMHHDCALGAASAFRNELLRLQLTSTLLRLSLWQAPYATVQSGNGGALAKFRRFRQKLEADFATHHQVQYYASALGMSEKSLSRACFETIGVPAKTCITRRLVLEGKRLLAHTNKPVQVIGQELGFDEATNFVKFFRRFSGTTPLEFRKD